MRRLDEAEWRREVKESVNSVREELGGEIARVERESLFERRWGVLLLVVGVFVSTVANLVA